MRADDGVELALYRAESARTRRTPLLLVHGTFSNRTFFLGTGGRGLARYLAGRGFDAWVPELRGHGRSGAQGKGTHWRFEDWIRRDAPALLAGVRQATGSDRVAWIGHSAGGVIAFAYAGLGEAESATIGGIVSMGAPAPTRPGAWHVPLSAIGYGITRVMNRFPARALGIGPEDEQPGIMEQWMAWNVRGRWIGDGGTDYLAAAGRITVPLLVLAGHGDFMAPPGSCRRLAEVTASTDRTFMDCGRRTGFPQNFSHDGLVVSKAARETVWPVIATWLEERFD